MSEVTMEHPAHFEISEEDGSAYYVIDSEQYGPELIQVPLDAETSEPDWEGDLGNGDFGGGQVDWQCGIEDEATRTRLKAIESRLLAKMRGTDTDE